MLQACGARHADHFTSGGECVASDPRATEGEANTAALAKQAAPEVHRTITIRITITDGLLGTLVGNRITSHGH